MAKVVGDIAVSVEANVSGFEKGMKRAGRSVDRFDKKAAVLAQRMVAVGAAVATAVTAMTTAAFAASKEITNLARLSGVGVVQFQKYAAAGESVGFSQEKMADIFKDTNDKFGDFLATGAGPLKDFFEQIAPKIGVTADQFARLSGPEALQLYVTSLEKAGVSQQKMTFYMEALANDATALIPLLRNSGQAMNDLGNAAQRSGAIIDEALIGRGNEIAEKWRKIMNSMVGYTYQGALQMATMIDNAFGFTDSGRIELMRTQQDEAVSRRNATLKTLMESEDSLSKFDLGSSSANYNAGTDAYVREFRNRIETGKIVLEADEAELNIINERLLEASKAASERAERLAELTSGRSIVQAGTPIGSGGVDSVASGAESSNGGSGLDAKGFESFRQQLATQAEQIDFWREDQIERLREFREAKIATDEEFNALEADINKQHAEALAEIEMRSRQQKLTAFSGALGDLSSLMASENKKLFNVGKAAALAQAVLEGYSSASAAWNKGMIVGGPPVAAAFAAASVLKTGSIVSSISSASASGGGGGGSSGGGTPLAAPVAPLEVRASGFTADQLFTGDAVSGLFDQLQDEAGDRGIKVSFVQ